MRAGNYSKIDCLSWQLYMYIYDTFDRYRTERTVAFPPPTHHLPPSMASAFDESKKKIESNFLLAASKNVFHFIEIAFNGFFEPIQALVQITLRISN